MVRFRRSGRYLGRQVSLLKSNAAMSERGNGGKKWEMWEYDCTIEGSIHDDNKVPSQSLIYEMVEGRNLNER